MSKDAIQELQVKGEPSCFRCPIGFSAICFYAVCFCAVCLGSGGRQLLRRLDDERLVDVQHEERQEDGDEDASFHLRGDGIVTAGAERVASRQPPGAQPAPPQESVHLDGLGRVVGAGGQEAAGTPKIR